MMNALKSPSNFPAEVYDERQTSSSNAAYFD